MSFSNLKRKNAVTIPLSALSNKRPRQYPAILNWHIQEQDSELQVQGPELPPEDDLRAILIDCENELKAFRKTSEYLEYAKEGHSTKSPIFEQDIKLAWEVVTWRMLIRNQYYPTLKLMRI